MRNDAAEGVNPKLVKMEFKRLNEEKLPSGDGEKCANGFKIIH